MAWTRGGWWSVATIGMLGSAPAGIPGHPESDQQPARDVRTIRALREGSNAAIARHDTAGVGAILAPNVIVVTSTSVALVGRETMVRAFADQFAARPDLRYRRTPSEVRIFSRWLMASEAGRWTGTWTAADGPVRIGGAYFAKWRQVDGRWLVESETYVPESCTGGQYCAVSPAPR